MTEAEILKDAFGRVRAVVADVLDGLTEEDLRFRPDPGSNSIAWLVWHLTRVQDDHVAAVSGTPQVWSAQQFSTRFALPFPEDAIGYGQSPSEASMVVADGPLLAAYLEAVHAATIAFVEDIDAAALDRVVDERWDPPVTLGVRLVSVIGDDLQHAGQAAYVRGLLERSRGE